MSQIKKGLNMAKNSVMNFVKEEDGVGVVEIILILVVLVALVVVFRDSIEDIVTTALDKIQDDSDSLTE